MIDQRPNDSGGALAVVEEHPQALALTDELRAWQLMRQQADTLVKSGFLGPIKSAEQALAIMVLGKELGFKPMQSFRLIDVIQGKPTLNAQGMAALVQDFCRHHGGHLRPIESTDQQAVIEIWRPEWAEPQRVVFTLEDAKRAGLTAKDTWKQYPKQMLWARAVMIACRMGWPDVVGGIYDADELGGAATAGPGGYVNAEVTIADAPEFAPNAALSAGERVDLTTGEIIGPDPRDPKEVAMAHLHAQGAERGLDHDGIKRVAATVLPAAPASLTAWTEAMLRDLAEHIELASDTDLAAWQTDWLAEIEAATDEEALLAVGQEMAKAGVTRTTHRDFLAAFNRRKLALRGTGGGELPGMPADADRHTA